MDEYLNQAWTESLTTHMRAISKGIGPRPSTSDKEKQAANYVEDTLRELGLSDIHRQSFKSQNSAGWTTIPSFLIGFVAVILALFGGQWGKLIGGVFLLVSAHTFRQSALVISPFYSKLIKRWTSQNVIAKIAAKAQAQQTIYLVGHLDSQKQRFQFPPSIPEIMKTQSSLPIALGAFGGILSLIVAFSAPESQSWWLWFMGAAYSWGVLGGLYDEFQPYVEGANDNTTAISLLLSTAEALKDNPLEHTDVILLFTGCEEVGCVGMESYLQEYAPSRENTFWIDIEMVGTGNLCYVTKHGISYLSTYTPHPRMVALAEEAAQEHPKLGVKGKDMVIVEEVANLSRRGYKALCLAGYNEKGILPNWHRLSDKLENIEAETLSRAAHYTWALMQKIDKQTCD